ncbi:uncharacterized protein PHALS_12325 [Plasmopara halstedii]|uniref:Uncharacterized protein n=1 Tax=Plasmopara halstedii TaxID=4781 RepID=A0A0P1AM79_PLAHL|nr:uncharacterized protein PHALS_12325 [Plasmopara halstedii]CEG42018.1 hypothetical protein PHALS_12325 [Plasmopara halstedii]|eukprot:XP_024578387.1 hypothetical protein PHALS_12325 [Plasmopara halstedii]
MRERKVTKPGIKETITMLKLPLLDKWSPSTSLRMLMHEFFQEVQRLDPTPCISLSNKSTLKIKSRQQHSTSKKPMKMRRRDVRGTVYPCQEVDIATSTLKHVHLLLQAGNIALIVSSKHGKVEKDNDYVYVQDLISLKDVVRITPQRGKSLTLFFKDRSLLCRTFLSPYTDDIIRDLRAMINDSRQYSRDEAAAGSAAQLLPFLSAEQTEKAKEMSTKLMSKLGKVATSVSRFLRGDEDENLEQHVDPLAKAFADINAQKEICYRMPSKARVTEITRRYQNIAEEYAYLNNQEGHVERAISELQRFIEHPRVQRILMESVAYEQSTKGIRVGPA